MDKLFNEIKDIENPFQEEFGDLLTLDSKVIAHTSAVDLLNTHLGIVISAFEEFFDREGNANIFYESIKKNITDLFAHK